MPSPPFDIAWYRALTLRERAALFRAGRLSASRDSASSESAQKRLAAWRAQAPFDREPWMRERLASEGLDEPGFLAILSASAEGLRAAVADPPEWLIELHQARDAARGAGSPAAALDRAGAIIETRAPPDPIPYPEWVERDPTGRFLVLFAPLVERARRELKAGLESLPFLAASPQDLDRMLLVGLPMGLAAMLERTAVLELRVARLEGHLTGDTPEQRFDSFIGLLSQADFRLRLLREYPVLARCAAEHIRAWVDSSLELMRRLGADWGDLRAGLLGRSETGSLTELRMEAGDAHRGGRSVAVLGFASGARLVYKPRPLAMEARFQELLGWLNGCGAEPGFRTLGVLDRGEYGWVEFAAEAPCASAHEVERYFRRLGGLLAVLHATGAMDFHFQNVVASGEHPVAVDLESLFHPPLPCAPVERADERIARDVLGDSVLRVGMLPFRVSEAEGGGRQDWSGVAAVAGQASPDPVLDWERPGTDEMHAVMRRLAMKGARNRPTLEGHEADAADHIGPLAEGFERTRRILLERRDDLLAPGGPLDAVRDQVTRIVLRTTRGYALLLDQSWHPDFLRDALDRDRFLDRLWVGADEMPAWWRVAGYDQRDLWRGDIPWFGSQPGSRDLWTSGGEVLPGFFAESGLEWARRRLREMGEDDLSRQSWFTRVSLGTLLLDSERGEWPEYRLDEAVGASPDRSGLASRDRSELRDSLVAEARRLGAWYERMAWREREHLVWIALDLRQGVWSLYPCSEDLYAGVPGIALFLGILGTITREERWVDLARRGMGTLLEKLETAHNQVPFIGLYQGWGSVLYTVAHLGSSTGDRALLEAGERLIPRIRERLSADRLLDVVGGAAGAIAALLALHRTNESSAALEAALLCGEHLLATARPTGQGISWLTELNGDEPPTGFAHGAAGIATALVGLAEASGDRRFLDAGLGGFAFEREALKSEVRRGHIGTGGPGHGETSRELALTWCYGAPGMGLARLRALKASVGLDPAITAALRRDVDEALAITLERGFGRNHCLCHGDLGNLDFVSQAACLDPSDELRARIDSLTRAVLASLDRDGWRCGTVAGIEAPGLMNGLAGIGYGLLRLAEPDRVPSVLAMEGPRAGRPTSAVVSA
ncbi:MAG: type 2 lantipeptide synthetase LanM [Candidatus Eisenbacteria bacterium]|uniref:Type 2 lantipeptide synthetase LanM n=1 Tax=Eiseniibacteriota bacterium TaxID=2212470 RepID=A0A538TMK8_UNCEI|nr:MAG: type 2 lantipeptide synthetase LanM [Candidatus Eisenbacteria bacterium]